MKEPYILNTLHQEITSLPAYHTRELVSGIASLHAHHLSSSSSSEQSTLRVLDAHRASSFGTFLAR